MRNYYHTLSEKFKIHKHLLPFSNCLIILFLIILPYFLFQGKLFIGGDDTRLFYAYPKEYLINTQFFSWTNLSSFGWNFSYQSFLPFVSLWTILSEIIKSKIVLGYLSISLPLILGLIFFQKFIRELIIDKEKHEPEILLGSSFYIFSPIILYNHFVNPLIPIWLIGLIPALCYYFLKFVKTGNLLDILKGIILTSIFSFGSHNSPWVGGFFIPITASLITCLFLFKKESILQFFKKFFIFFGFIFFSQFFWLLGFLLAFLSSSSNSFTSNVVSEAFSTDFARTILATSTGTIIYPLLNLFHRQIAFDYGLSLKEIYQIFYDKTYFLNFIFIIVLFLGILNFRKTLLPLERKIYLVLLVAFLVSLYLFTVNIGPLKALFIEFGYIPGFVIFRNAYDKFALGYTIIYSLLITYCLVIIKKRYLKMNKVYLTLISLFLLATLINILPIKKIMVSPLQTTENIYKNITIPQEYLEFMKEVKGKIVSTNNVLSVPYGISLYSVIKDEESNNVYAGLSPLIIFTGVNDISGGLSFNYAPEASRFEDAIINKNYDVINNILFTRNINYVFVTKNVPDEVKKSYLFNLEALKAQNEDFISNITDKKIITSAKGNYELYSTKERNSLISGDNLTFKKISRVKYKILIKNIKDKQEILFNDSYHPGWSLYLVPMPDSFNCQKPNNIADLKTTECRQENAFFEIEDLSFIWEDPVFEESQTVNNQFSNKWIIDPDWIRKNFDKKYYKVNKDGSMDLELVLYFKPQAYFYIGVAISIITVGVLIILIYLKRK